MLALEDRTVPSGSDLFASATVLSGNIVTDTGSNVERPQKLANRIRTSVPWIGQSLPIKSIWWQWTAPVRRARWKSILWQRPRYTCWASTPALDVVEPHGVTAATNDDAGSTQSQVLFDGVAGTTYFIAVDGYAGSFSEMWANVLLHLGTHPTERQLRERHGCCGWYRDWKQPVPRPVKSANRPRRSSISTRQFGLVVMDTSHQRFGANRYAGQRFRHGPGCLYRLLPQRLDACCLQ